MNQHHNRAGSLKEEIEIFAHFNKRPPNFENGRHLSALPTPGAKIRAMLVCQPPVLEMAVSTNCCVRLGTCSADSPLESARKICPVKSFTGITIGNLLDAAAKIENEHRLCPFADPNDHDLETGNVRLSISFQGKAVLRNDDPQFPPVFDARMARRPASDVSNDDYMDERSGPNSGIIEYIEAKQAGTLQTKSIRFIVYFH